MRTVVNNNYSMFFESIADDEEFRQGDVIRRIQGDAVSWGVIITADCDIAQRKAGNRYTSLEILPLSRYLDEHWAGEQLRKVMDKQGRAAAEALNGHIKRSGHSLTPLTAASVCEWLRADLPAQILSAATGKPGFADQKTTMALEAVRTALGVEGGETDLRRLLRVWSILGQDEKRQRENLLSALQDSGGFQDFVLVPELPKTDGFGYIVMLRSVFSIDSGELFFTEQDARINDRPDAYHRLGRLNDRLKFAIAQKMAFLFSRIGMLTAFESACEAASELAIGQLFDSKGEGDSK